MFEIDGNIVDDYASSDLDAYDSDKIDSDIESELYSSVHHETTLDSQDNIDKNDSINVVSEHNAFLHDLVPEDSLIKKCESHNREKKVKSLNVSHTNSTTSAQLKSIKMPLKRKSNLVKSLLDNIQLSFVNKKLRREDLTTERKSQMNKSVHRNMTNHLAQSQDSESDDSVILIESDEPKPHTNIEEAVSILSSNSDISSDEDDFISSRTRNNSLHSSCIEGVKGDPWHINHSDIYRPKTVSSRYHYNTLNCSHCRRSGHSARFCTEIRMVKKCYICGNRHIPQRCPNKFCGKCMRFGHCTEDCFVNPYLDFLKCRICQMRGHKTMHCPDLWRRYHLTTTESTIVQGKVINKNVPAYCFNCGKEGHFGYRCSAPRKGIVIQTCVRSYRNPQAWFDRFENPAYQNEESVLNRASQSGGSKNLLKKKKRLERIVVQKEKWTRRIVNLASCSTQKHDFPRSPKQKHDKNGNEENNFKLISITKKKIRKKIRSLMKREKKLSKAISEHVLDH